MSAPLTRLYATPDTHLYNRLRDIENNYYLETTTEHLADIINSQTDILGALARQAESDHDLAECFGEFSATIINALDSLNDALQDTRHAIDKQTTILGGRLEEIGRTLLLHRQTLVSIAETLRRPFETQVLELRQEADKWLRTGLNNQGDQRIGDLRDAERLLAEIVKNPIGNQDYVSWFQLGYLRWKLDVDLSAAEEAFARSVRLSAPTKDRWHINALRHLAHIQALNGHYEKALEAILRAAELDPSPEVYFETARCHANLGNSETAIDFLERAIDRQPTLLVNAFTDEDLASLRPAIGQLAESKRLQALARAEALFDSARAAVARLAPWNSIGGVGGDLVLRLSRAQTHITAGRFFQLLEVIDGLVAISDQVPLALELLQTQAADQWLRRRQSLKGAYQHLRTEIGRGKRLDSDLHAEYELLMRHGSPSSVTELQDLLDGATRLQNQLVHLRHTLPASDPGESQEQRPEVNDGGLLGLVRRLRSLFR